MQIVNGSLDLKNMAKTAQMYLQQDDIKKAFEHFYICADKGGMLVIVFLVRSFVKQK